MSPNRPDSGRNQLPGDPDRLRRRLYEVMDDEGRTLAEKQRRALEIGRAYLGVENGHIERVEEGADTHEVVASVGDGDLLPEGTTLDRATTYCRRTLEADSPMALTDAPEQGWADDPAYREHGFDCYLGTTVFADGEPYGTVCFVSRAARAREFDGGEKAFVELLARLLGRELESHRHDRELGRRERDLQLSERKYGALLDAAPDAIFLADAETDEIHEANAAAADLVGYSPDELVGMDVLDLHPPGSRERYEGLFDRFVGDTATLDRFPDGTPLRVRHRDGSDIPVEMSASTVDLGGRTYVQGILRDVSERRERERDLRLKDRAMEEASVGITIADATDEDLPLVYANREFERATGYDREDALGRNCRFLQGPDTDEEATDALREAIESREPITTDLLNYRADGTPFWNELTVAPVTDEDGATTHFVGFQRDITARKRRERLVAVLNRVLRHNLRNDMSVVTNYADELAEKHDGEVRDMATRIRKTADDLIDLSEKAQTLELTMRDPGDPRARDVSTDLSAVIADLRGEYPEASASIEGEDGQRVIATERLGIALRELGRNAVEHSSTGDRTPSDNAVEHAEGSPEVTYRVHADGGDVACISVSDNGPGLDGSEQRVLRTGHESPLEHGRGLGLWLVNWIVTSVGGQVSTEVDDDGTTVTLRLPTEQGAGTDGPADRHRRAAICLGAG